jgi:hypothetical protein
MSNEENILNGIIDNNIKYFIDTFDTLSDTNINACFIDYFNDYIVGDLVDVNEVYKNIFIHFEEKILDICSVCLDKDVYKEFILRFMEFLNKNIACHGDFKIYSILFLNENTTKFIKDEPDIFYGVCDLVLKKDQLISYNFMLKLLKNKNLRQIVLDYIDSRIDLAKEQRDILPIIDLNLPYLHDRMKDNQFNINLLVMLIDLWSTGITNDKLFKINRGETNFLSICFYQIHTLIDYGLINIYDEKDYRLRESTKIKRMIENNNVSQHMLSILDNYIETRLKNIYEIISNKKLIFKMNTFYDKTCIWLNETSKKADDDKESRECYNDILETMYAFIKNNKIVLNDNLTQIIVSIFNGHITKNPNIKINYLALFNNYLLEVMELNIKTTGLLHFVSWDTNINKIIGHILTLGHDMKSSFNNDEIYNMLYPMSLLTNVFNTTIYNLEDYRYYFNQKKNDKYLKELIYDNLNNFQFVVDEILSVLIKINRFEKEIHDLEALGESSLTQDQKNEIEEKKMEIEDEKDKINNFNIYLDIFSKFIIKSCKYYIKIVLSNETRHCFTNICISIITNLTAHQKRYKVLDKSGLKFIPIDILVTLKNILTNCILNKDDEAILVKLIGEHDGYIKNSVLRLINILSKKDQIKTLEYSYLSYFDNKINVVIESNEDIEVPDELCDPLMDTLIENPVMLPNDIIIDLGTISRHLLTSETNPFDRSPLTMELLEEYNKKPCVKNKIDEFKMKLKEFSDN